MVSQVSCGCLIRDAELIHEQVNRGTDGPFCTGLGAREASWTARRWDGEQGVSGLKARGCSRKTEECDLASVCKAPTVRRTLCTGREGSFVGREGCL